VLDEGRFECSSNNTKGEGRLQEDFDAIAAAPDHYWYFILLFLKENALKAWRKKDQLVIWTV